MLYCVCVVLRVCRGACEREPMRRVAIAKNFFGKIGFDWCSCAAKLSAFIPGSVLGEMLILSSLKWSKLSRFVVLLAVASLSLVSCSDHERGGSGGGGGQSDVRKQMLWEGTGIRVRLGWGYGRFIAFWADDLDEDGEPTRRQHVYDTVTRSAKSFNWSPGVLRTLLSVRDGQSLLVVEDEALWEWSPQSDSSSVASSRRSWKRIRRLAERCRACIGWRTCRKAPRSRVGRCGHGMSKSSGCARSAITSSHRMASTGRHCAG